MKKRMVLFASVAIACILAACGGGGGGASPAAASADATLSMNPNVAAAATGDQFQFSSVPDFGTTSTTTVQISGSSSSSSDTFQVNSGGSSASGSVQYGSCIFHVTSSTFPSGSPLATGNTVTISNCQLLAHIKGTASDGQNHTSLMQLILNAVTSLNLAAQVSISADGALTINGQNVGFTVTLAPTTGS